MKNPSVIDENGTSVDVEFVFIKWDARENIFYDLSGNKISNIHEWITPNDLYLFRHDPGYSIFSYVGNNKVLCEILVDDDWPF